MIYLILILTLSFNFHVTIRYQNVFLLQMRKNNYLRVLPLFVQYKAPQSKGLLSRDVVMTYSERVRVAYYEGL